MSVRFVGLELEHPLMNGAGTCKTLEDVSRFARSAVSGVLVGSITVEPRLGNAGSVFYGSGRWAVNALGMPNRGVAYYVSVLPVMVENVHGVGKPLGVSVAGFSPSEYVSLASSVVGEGADFVELNLGCPNVWLNGAQKRVAAFDPALVGTIVDRVVNAVEGAVPVGVKLSPYSDPYLLIEVAGVLASTGVSYVATTNTFPNALALGLSNAPILDVGYGGLSGCAMKPVGLGQVAQFRAALPAHIHVVGVGGIVTGADVHEYASAGATAVQLATAYWKDNENPRVFSAILEQYAEQLALT